ncbi:uncharacterized protein TNCV_3362731 [Trichonephila clavipes]|nr:uncharacterized protein TNCV_3362731 [Trichonephila clavipes]
MRTTLDLAPPLLTSIPHQREDLKFDKFNVNLSPVHGGSSVAAGSSSWHNSHGIRAHYKQISEIERDRIIGLKEAGWVNKRITCHMGRSDAAIRRCWQEWVDSSRFQRHDGSGRPKATTDRDNRLTVRSAVTALDSSLSLPTVTQPTTHACTLSIQITLCPDNHPRCVWRRLGQRVDPAFNIARHTSPQPGVMVWGAISFVSLTPLGVIKGPLIAQRYVNDILRTVLLPFLLQYLGLIFCKLMTDHKRHVLLWTVLQLVKHFLDQPDHQISLQSSMSGI